MTPIQPWPTDGRSVSHNVCRRRIQPWQTRWLNSLDETKLFSLGYKLTTLPAFCLMADLEIGEADDFLHPSNINAVVTISATLQLFWRDRLSFAAHIVFPPQPFVDPLYGQGKTMIRNKFTVFSRTIEVSVLLKWEPVRINRRNRRLIRMYRSHDKWEHSSRCLLSPCCFCGLLPAL